VYGYGTGMWHGESKGIAEKRKQIWDLMHKSFAV
jgi:hypothetical protein